MTPQQVKAYRIMDNRSGEIAKWDHDLLLAEMDDIVLEEPLFDSGFLGFDIQNIDEPTEKKKWDTSDVHDEFVVTIRGPLPLQDDVVQRVKEIPDCEVEVSHVKRPKKGEGIHTYTITEKAQERSQNA